MGAEILQSKAEAKALRASRKAQRAPAAPVPEAEYSHLDRPAARTAQPSAAPSGLGAEEDASERPAAVTGLPDNRPQSIHVKVQGKPAATLPTGFFDDQKKDNAAHGIKEATKRDKEVEFIQFQLQVDAEVEKQAVFEADEAEQAAIRRAAEEEFSVQYVPPSSWLLMLLTNVQQDSPALHRAEPLPSLATISV